MVLGVGRLGTTSMRNKAGQIVNSHIATIDYQLPATDYLPYPSTQTLQPSVQFVQISI